MSPKGQSMGLGGHGDMSEAVTKVMEHLNNNRSVFSGRTGVWTCCDNVGSATGSLGSWTLLGVQIESRSKLEMVKLP